MLSLLNVLVAFAAGVKGCLSDQIANAYALKFREGAWKTFDEVTSIHFNACVLYFDKCSAAQRYTTPFVVSERTSGPQRR